VAAVALTLFVQSASALNAV
jgi:uncharacterized membrane protein YfcA